MRHSFKFAVLSSRVSSDDHQLNYWPLLKRRLALLAEYAANGPWLRSSGLRIRRLRLNIHGYDERSARELLSGSVFGAEIPEPERMYKRYSPQTDGDFCWADAEWSCVPAFATPGDAATFATAFTAAAFSAPDPDGPAIIEDPTLRLLPESPLDPNLNLEETKSRVAADGGGPQFLLDPGSWEFPFQAENFSTLFLTKACAAGVRRLCRGGAWRRYPGANSKTFSYFKRRLPKSETEGRLGK